MNAPFVATNTLHVSNCGTPAASAVASRLGLLDEAGQKNGVAVVDIRDPQLAGDIRVRHWDHALGSLIREGGNIPPLWTRAAGTPTRLLGLTWVDEYQAILVRADAGVRDVADLRGRRVGVPVRPELPIDFVAGLSLRGLSNGLGLAGLTLGDVVRVDIAAASSGGSDGPDAGALLNGDVDAIYVHGIHGVASERHPDIAELVAFGSHPDPLVRANAIGPRTITVHQDLLDAHPDVVVDYLVALIRASDYARDNPDAVLTYFGVSGDNDLESLRKAYGPGPTLRYRPTLDADVVEVLAHHAAFLAEHGVIRPGLDIPGWIDPAPLAAALARI